jgi:aminoglycoside phosphotransferase (APT) family kinase protein
MDLSHLGTPTGLLARVHGGFANRMYRLDTDRGSFAVKEMNLLDRRMTYHADDVLRFERAAFAAGIPMPEPVSAGHGVLVHRWVEGEKIPEAPVPTAYAFEVGRILARIHTLDVRWTGPSDWEPAPRDWPDLAERARTTGQPWADELTSRVRTFLAVAEFVDTCERPGPVVLTHRDVQPWNLLARDGRPVLLDWELSGMLDLSGELGATALGIAKGPGLDDIRPAVFTAVLDGYTAGGGTVPPPGPNWFAFLIGGWLGHTRWNILRCLASAETGAGPGLALSDQSATDGIRGLPELFDRLPDLEDLFSR